MADVVPKLDTPVTGPGQVDYDENGFDEWGFNREGYDERGFNAIGLDEQGYNEKGLNINGYTLEQQEAYDAYVTLHPEYHPKQSIRPEDRYWGS